MTALPWARSSEHFAQPKQVLRRNPSSAAFSGCVRPQRGARAARCDSLTRPTRCRAQGMERFAPDIGSPDNIMDTLRVELERFIDQSDEQARATSRKHELRSDD